MDGEQDTKCVLTPGIDERAFIAFEAYGNGASCAPLSSGTGPRSDGLGLVLQNHERPLVGADGLSADSVCSIGPIEAHEGGKRFCRETGHV
jgi:hypothetical protein